MKGIRSALYILVTAFVVLSVLAGVKALQLVAKLAPIHKEGEAVLLAAPTAFFPTILIGLIAYLISCVDKD